VTTVLQYIRRHLEAQVFLDPLPRPTPLAYVQARQTQVEQFETYARNRMGFGWYRYRHNFHDGEPPRFDAVASAIDRLRRYRADGNQEHLIDAANLCKIEFAKPSHPAPHFTPIDDGEHSKPIG